MRKILAILIAILPLATDLSARDRNREPRVMGVPMSVSDTSSNGRRLAQRLFIGKGEVGLGVSFSYLDIDSNNSDYLMLLQNCNAYAKTFSVVPTIAYAVRDNKVIGMRFKYSTSSGNISDADLSLLSEDLTLNVSRIRASLHAWQDDILLWGYRLKGLQPLRQAQPEPASGSRGVRDEQCKPQCQHRFRRPELYQHKMYGRRQNHRQKSSCKCPVLYGYH